MALTVLSLEIPPSEALSNALDCRAGRIVRLGMPSQWTPAALTFQVSPDGQTYLDMYHTQVTTGAFVPYEVVVPTVVPGTMLSLPPDSGASAGWIKVRSGTRDTPVAQQGRRTFLVVFESNPA
jgi:hypothetical protein